MSRVFVVDTCVAHAAGGPDATFPTSKRSRDFLMLLQECRHRVAFDPQTRDEWRDHRSRFAYTWLTAMYARKLVVRAEGEAGERVLAGLQVIATLPDHHRKAIAKDAAIVGTAMANDRLLASVDRRLLAALLDACAALACVRGLLWIDVDRLGDELAAWVCAGAPPERLPVAEETPVTVVV